MMMQGKRGIAAIRYMAIIFYSTCIGYGVLMHMVIWKGLLKGQLWTLWAIVIAWVVVATAAFAADRASGGVLPPLNRIYNAPFLTGIVVPGFGLHVRRKQLRMELDSQVPLLYCW